MKITRLGCGILFVIMGGVLLTGCGGGTPDPMPEAEKTKDPVVFIEEQETEPPASDKGTGKDALDGSDLQGNVVELADDGVIVTRIKRWENADGMFGQSTEDKISIHFTGDTVFQIFEYNASAAQGEFQEADSGKVLLDSNIFLWGEMDGDSFVSNRVVIWRQV